MQIELDFSNPEKSVREIAADFISRDPLIFDTETTGLGPDDEIIEITLIDCSGDIKLDTLIKPIKKIPADSSRIHGITNDMVINAPALDSLWTEQLSQLFGGRALCIYNSDFDLRMIKQSLKKYGLKWANPEEVLCLMKLYGRHRQVWDDYYNHYKWFKLTTAARECSIQLPEKAHRSLADAELTRKLLLFLAEPAPEK